MNAFRNAALLLVLPAVLAAPTSFAEEGTVVFTHVNLVTMTDDTVQPDRAVVVRGARIAEILSSEGLHIPAGAEVIDGHGAYLMPGLADMHTHLNDAFFTHPFFNLFLANGVTTIRDLAQASPPSVLQYRREIENGTRLGPHIYVANIYWGWEPDPVGLLLAQQPLGYDCAKLNSYFSRQEFNAIAEQAKQRKVYTLGHIPYAVGLSGVLAAGMNEVSHVDEVILSEMIGLDHEQDLTPDQWNEQMVATAVKALLPYRDSSPEEIRQAFQDNVRAVMEKLAGKDLAFTTTLICDEDTVDKLFHPETLRSSPHAPFIAPQFWQDVEKGTDKHMKMLPQAEWRGFVVFSELGKILAREMKRNGVLLVLGTDVGPTYLSLVPGFSVHDELQILVENGFTPYEALATATRNASEVCARMTGRNEFGTIESGKRADLVLVDGNPLVDIATARKPLGVMAAGRWLAADTLDALLEVTTRNIKDDLRASYEAGGIEGALREYHVAKGHNLRNENYFSCEVLNELGYELLGAGKIDEAVRLFELNVAEYPEEPNNYDSLAEAYMKRGDNLLAIQYYRKALALNPDNTNAMDMLKTLEAK
jgi:imidazolonepropionase-like amidohydrolase